VTETCDEDEPRLITNVETSSGPTADGATTPTIHQSLKDKDLLPERHIVDTGYLDAELLVESQRDFGVDLIGPARRDYKWQAREETGFDAWPRSSSTGRNRKRFAQRGTPASAGHPPWISAPTR